MARYSGGDGFTKVAYVTAIADISAPSVGTELNSAADWSQFIIKGGLKEPNDQNNMPVANLAERFNAQHPSSFGGAIELTAMRDDTVDTVWDTVAFGVAGFLVIRSSGIPSSSAFATSDPLRVYPVTFHDPVMADPASDTPDQFTVMAPVTSEPDVKAVAAA